MGLCDTVCMWQGTASPNNASLMNLACILGQVSASKPSGGPPPFLSRRTHLPPSVSAHCRTHQFPPCKPRRDCIKNYDVLSTLASPRFIHDTSANLSPHTHHHLLWLYATTPTCVSCYVFRLHPFCDEQHRTRLPWRRLSDVVELNSAS